MHNRRWVGDDLHNLLYLQTKDLRIIYPGHNWESMRAKRKLYRRKIKQGLIMPPKRSEEYPGPEEERTRALARREALSKPLGQKALTDMISMEGRKKLHDQLDDIIDRTALPPEHIEALRVKKISHWEMGYKDTEGEPGSHPLYGIQLEADPVKFEPEWPPVHRVEPAKRMPRQEQSEKDRLRRSRKAVILPDLQFPFQDEKAVEVALNVLRDVKPDKVVILGDLLDLTAFSKYEQRPEYASQTQGAIDQALQMLMRIRQLAPKAEIAVLEGNHDRRMVASNLRNWMATYGLKRGIDSINKEGHAVNSLPHLLSFDMLDIEYVSGYPANRYWINENLQVRHGHRVRSGGSTAKLVNDDERVSTIFGHVHRIETQFKTVHTYEGGKTNAAYSIGCLCKIDGSVPSVKGGVDLSGNPVTNYEDWQQALCVVDYEEGNAPFNVAPLYINTFNGYQTIYNGRRYGVTD